MKFAWGCRKAWAGASRMVSEKISASTEAAGTLMMGGSVGAVIDRYREHVGANIERLTAGR